MACSVLMLLVVSAAVAIAGAGRGAVPARTVVRGVTIANWAPRAIRELYLSPATSPDWGVDRLEGRAIPPADDRKLTYGGACRADLRVVFDNGGAEERHDIDFCGGPYLGIRPGWTTEDDVAGLTPPALVAVRNRSGRTMARLYLFPDGAAEEGDDRLGHGVLPNGDTIEVSRPIAATCAFSLRVVFEDDAAAERYGGIDLCHYHGIMVEPRPDPH